MRARDPEAELIDAVAAFEHDPLGFVIFAFPWGKKGGPLEGVGGPRRWQRRALERLGNSLRKNKGCENQIIREAFASGHGIGKSAFMAMIIMWAMSTKEDTRVILTAGTDAQLKTKTWPEMNKWFNMCITAHWFTFEETSVYSRDPDRARSWSMDRVTWNARRPEAFAGAHNAGKRLLLMFDEASQIDDVIWETTEGALTDQYTEIIWYAFGNPTRREGAFFRIFNADKDMWSNGAPQQINAEDVEGCNREQQRKWEAKYGRDSDFYRVRVLGKFPRASDLQFISHDFVVAAQHREVTAGPTDPLIMALDVARGGQDEAAFVFRRGNDARTIPMVRIPGADVRNSMKLVDKAEELVKRFRPDHFVVDATGGSVGGPVADRLRQLGYRVHDVQFAASAPDDIHYANLRAYMWDRMRTWLENTGAIPEDPDLETDLEGPQSYHDKKDRLLLESKEDMKGRGLASPDRGDALAMTFAFRFALKEVMDERSSNYGQRQGAVAQRAERGSGLASLDLRRAAAGRHVVSRIIGRRY